MQIFKQESIPVGFVPPTCQLYVFQWLPLDVSMGVCPQMNKFEQVSSDDHQMSVAGWYPRSQGQKSGVPYHVTYSMMRVMYIPPARTK